MSIAIHVSPEYFERPVPIGIMPRLFALEAAAWCAATGAGRFFSQEAFAELNSRRLKPYQRSAVSKLVAAGIFKRAEGGWLIIDPLLGIDQEPDQVPA
jgi:hypothetical protein